MAVIQRQVEHLVRLIDDLVDVSRITRGLIGLRREILDMPSLVAQAAEATRPALEARQHIFTVAIPDERLPVEGDAARLAQVLANILSNAAKFTEPGGYIHLDLRREDAHVRLQVYRRGAAARTCCRGFFGCSPQRQAARSGRDRAVGLALVRRLVRCTADRGRRAKDRDGTVRSPSAAAHSRRAAASEAGRPERRSSAVPHSRRRRRGDAAEVLA
jgi:K+-sensing histidine kinase KdpD